MAHEGNQAVKNEGTVGVFPFSQPGSHFYKPSQQVGIFHGPSAEDLQEVLKKDVPPEKRAEPDSPLVIALAVLPRPLVAEPQERLPSKVFKGRIERFRVQVISISGVRQIEPDGHVVLEKLPRRQPFLRDEGVGIEGFAEN